MNDSDSCPLCPLQAQDPFESGSQGHAGPLA